ncbi:MAG TPA: hypothetical protein VIK18_21580 [Pirellulales bacterium]
MSAPEFDFPHETESPQEAQKTATAQRLIATINQQLVASLRAGRMPTSKFVEEHWEEINALANDLRDVLRAANDVRPITDADRLKAEWNLSWTDPETGEEHSDGPALRERIKNQFAFLDALERRSRQPLAQIRGFLLRHAADLQESLSADDADTRWETVLAYLSTTLQRLSSNEGTIELRWKDNDCEVVADGTTKSRLRPAIREALRYGGRFSFQEREERIIDLVVAELRESRLSVPDFTSEGSSNGGSAQLWQWHPPRVETDEAAVPSEMRRGVPFSEDEVAAWRWQAELSDRWPACAERLDNLISAAVNHDAAAGEQDTAAAGAVAGLMAALAVLLEMTPDQLMAMLMPQVPAPPELRAQAASRQAEHAVYEALLKLVSRPA